MIDKFKGALLGLAVGDALGTTLEFSSPGSFTPITDMVGGGPFQLMAGQYTDDTSMALCIAHSLVEKEKFDPIDQLDKYINWMNNGYCSSRGECFDIGNITRHALYRFENSGQPYGASTATDTAGNGSIMRLAPVPMFYANQFEEGIIKSGWSSRTTHGATEAVDACRFMGSLIIGALNGEPKEKLLSEDYCIISDYWSQHPLSKQIELIAKGSYKEINPPKIIASGYVVKTLEAALWAFYNTNNFKDGALMAVNLGNDADTVGAVYGQIAGAYYGCKDIPSSWLDKMYDRELMETLAEKIYQLSSKQE